MKLVRLPDWPERLSSFIAEARDKPFAFGSFDCAMFACNAVLAMTAVDIAAAYRGSYDSQDSALKLLRKKNLLRIAQEIAKEFEMAQFEHPWASPRGSILILYRHNLMGYTLALNDGKYALAPLESGLGNVSLNFAIRAWRV